MLVKALIKTYYDRRDRMPGDVYEMDDREDTQIRLLEAIGTIQVMGKKQQPPKKQEYETKVVEPSSPPPSPPSTAVEPMTTEDSALVSPRRQRYKRRDMRPEK